MPSDNTTEAIDHLTRNGWTMARSKARSKAFSGSGNPMFGKRHTNEAKAKIGLASLNRSDETRAKIRLAKIGQFLTEEHKANISKALTGSNNPLYGKCHSEIAKAKMRLASTGCHPSEETLAKMSKAHKLHWLESEYVRKQMLSRNIKPNKSELYLAELIESACPNEWAFVGDWQLVIAGKCPDFANINGKKQVIELYGDHWHEGENPQDRIDLFSQYGWQTLIIWQSELKQPDKVLKRIAKFTKQRKRRLCHLLM